MRSTDRRACATLILILALAQHVLAAPLPTADLDAAVAGAKGRWDVLDAANAASDRYIEATIKPAHPEEMALWKGAGRWLAALAIEKAHPLWSELRPAHHQIDMWDDEDKDVQPLYGPKGSPTKAFGLLKMWDGYLGSGIVGKEIEQFLQDYDGQPVAFEQLYNRLKGPLPGWQAQRPWLDERGHPILHTSLVTTPEGTRLRYEQKGFSLYDTQPLGNEGIVWPVPLVLKYSDDQGAQERRVILTERAGELSIPARGKVRWLFPNGGGYGWFRTDVAPLAPLQAGAASGLTSSEQVALACNQWRLVRSGREPVGTFFDIVQATKSSPDLGLNDIFLVELGTIKNYVQPQDRSAYHRFMADSQRAFLDRHGWQVSAEEDPVLIVHKSIALRWMYRAGDPRAVASINDWVKRSLEGETALMDLHILPNDPRVFKPLRAAVEQSLHEQGKPGDAFYKLVEWTEPAGVAELEERLLGPASELSDQQKFDAARLLAHFGPYQDALWARAAADPAGFPAGKEGLALLLDSPYRPDLEKLVQSGQLDPTWSAYLTEMAASGSKRTLRNLSGQVHEWLQTSPFR